VCSWCLGHMCNAMGCVVGYFPGPVPSTAAGQRGKRGDQSYQSASAPALSWLRVSETHVSRRSLSSVQGKVRGGEHHCCLTPTPPSTAPQRVRGA
jgi:hypothetical protein